MDGLQKKIIYMQPSLAYLIPKSASLLPPPGHHGHITQALRRVLMVRQLATQWQTSTSDLCLPMKICCKCCTNSVLHHSFTIRWKWVLREKKKLTLITDLQDDSHTAKMKCIQEAPQERSMVLCFREIRLCIFKVLQYEFGLDKEKSGGEL